MPSPHLRGLAPYVGHPNATTVFAIVFKGGALNKTSALLKMAEKSDAVIFNSPVPRSWELPTQLKGLLQHAAGEYRGERSSFALRLYRRSSQQTFRREVNKLIQIKGGKGPG